jgi:hypothetical protein
MVVVGDNIITWKGFLKGAFLGLAVADLSDDGPHGCGCCTSLE